MRRTLVSTSIVLLACGPQRSDTTGSSSGTGSATDPTGTSTGSATVQPTTGEPLSCDAFLSPPPEGFKSVKISIVSKLAEPVWIDATGCGGLPLLRILDASAEDVFELRGECSPVECYEFLGAEDCTLGCNDCGSAQARRIGPGSTFAINWAASRGVPLQMTAECAPGNNCQRECLRPEPVDAGTYDVELTAFRQCSGTCDCDVADPNASCSLYEPIQTSEPLVVKVSLVYPETDAIELVLE